MPKCATSGEPIEADFNDKANSKINHCVVKSSCSPTKKKSTTGTTPRFTPPKCFSLQTTQKEDFLPLRADIQNHQKIPATRACLRLLTIQSFWPSTLEVATDALGNGERSWSGIDGAWCGFTFYITRQDPHPKPKGFFGVWKTLPFLRQK